MRASGDIAEEAGVAHGLLYHYFRSKEEVLEAVFRETWAELLAALRDVEASGEPASEQLRQAAAIVLARGAATRTWCACSFARCPQPELERRAGDVGDVFGRDRADRRRAARRPASCARSSTRA